MVAGPVYFGRACFRAGVALDAPAFLLARGRSGTVRLYAAPQYLEFRVNPLQGRILLSDQGNADVYTWDCIRVSEKTPSRQ